MNKDTATSLSCTCEASGDICPACYQARKNELQQKLWETTIKVATLQKEALELEDGFRTKRS